MESKELEQMLSEVSRLTQQNTNNIQHLTDAVNKLTVVAERQIAHEVKLNNFEGDKQRIVSRIDAMELKVNKLITKIEKEFESTKLQNMSAIQAHRIKMLLWMLSLVAGMASALALYVIKH